MKTAKTLQPISIRCVSALLAAIVCCATANASEIRGRVVDETGAAITGARVEFESRGAVYKATTDNAGGFFVVPHISSGTLRVSATGFSSATLQWKETRPAFTITLKLAPVGETVVVTGERNPTRIDETAANIVLLTSAEVNSRAAPTLDDALRQAPGFTLFRRSNSLTANPTTQGASARGVGASGASRVLVLDDGIPLNDAFGGWVFWDRVPRIAIDHAEVLQGGQPLYGSSAFGGVVDLIAQRHARLITLEATGDSLSGHDFQGVISHQLHGWLLSATGESFGNEGAFVVASQDRGSVDVPASLSFGNGDLRIEHKLGTAGTAFLRGSLFGEQRNNGTALQVNSTHLGSLSSGIDSAIGKNAFSFRLYGTGEHYHQSFSTIAANRNSEVLTRWQTAPSDQIGFSIQWMRPVGPFQVTSGLDGRFIHGETDETGFFGNLPINLNVAGGKDHLFGGFAAITTTIAGRLRVLAGVRADHWSNEDGFTRLTALSNGSTTFRELAPHSETAYSPQAGLVYSLNDRWQLTASAYGAFRAPTLNELYRGFRQGNVVTLSNEALQAERLQGGETGIRYLRRRILLSGIYFHENVDDPIGNITLITTPALITRQRRNIGALRIAGTDIDCLITLPRIQLRAGYEYVNSTVSSFSANPALVGKTVPQVPAHSASLSAVYTAPRHWTIIALARAASRQFDDDLNLLPLKHYSAVGISVSKQTGQLTWFVSAANLLDARIQTAATPVLNYATPRVVSAGMRLTSKR